MIERDYSELGTMSDTALARKWNVSRERIRQIRVKHGIEGFVRVSKNYQKIVNYLKNYGTESKFSISKLRRDLKLNQLDKNTKLNLTQIKNICKKENILLIFSVSEITPHGLYGYNHKRCRCYICNLANNIRSRFKNKILKKTCDYYANTFWEMAKSEKGKFKKNFYKFIEEDMEKQKINNQNLSFEKIGSIVLL